MERLTETIKGHGFCNGKQCTDDCDDCNHFHKILTKLAQYEDAEEQGLLLRLPCKVGTPVYMVESECNGDPLDCRCDCEDCRYYYTYVEEDAFETYMVDDIGKTLFLTKEEAEQKLESMKGE